MAKVLDMPKLSPTMEEGQISAWHKKVGDAVQVDELLADVETDKATMEDIGPSIRALCSRSLAPAGSVVKLGAPVAILGKPGEDVKCVRRREAPQSRRRRSQIPQGMPAIATAGEPDPQGDPAIAETAGSQIPQGGSRNRDRREPDPQGGSRNRDRREPDPQGEVPFSERVKASPYVRKRARASSISTCAASRAAAPAVASSRAISMAPRLARRTA